MSILGNKVEGIDILKDADEEGAHIGHAAIAAGIACSPPNAHDLSAEYYGVHLAPEVGEKAALLECGDRRFLVRATARRIYFLEVPASDLKHDFSLISSAGLADERLPEWWDVMHDHFREIVRSAENNITAADVTRALLSK